MLYNQKIIHAPENTFALVGDALPVRVLAYIHEELIQSPEDGDEEIQSEKEEVWIVDQFGESHLQWYPMGRGISKAELKEIEKNYEKYRLEGLASSAFQIRENTCKLPFKKYCELIGFEPEKYIYE